MAERMSRKAQDYFTKIKAAMNEYGLMGIEISIKLDTALAWPEFMELNRAVEERRVKLQTDGETAKLKEMIFFRARTELDVYLEMKSDEGSTAKERACQRGRFRSIYQIIEEAGLEDEYDAWKQLNV